MTIANALRKQGFELGMQLVAEERESQIVANMFSMGWSIDFISEITGLSIESLVKLKENRSNIFPKGWSINYLSELTGLSVTYLKKAKGKGSRIVEKMFVRGWSLSFICEITSLSV